MTRPLPRRGIATGFLEPFKDGTGQLFLGAAGACRAGVGRLIMDRTERFYRIDQLLNEQRFATFAQLQEALGGVSRNHQARPAVSARPDERADPL